MMVIEEAQLPQAALPVAALKQHLRLGTGFAQDDVQDSVLGSFLRAAIAAVEGQTEKALITRAHVVELSDWSDPCGQSLPRAPVITITQVTTIARSGMETDHPLTSFHLQRDAITPVMRPTGFSLPSVPHGGAVKIHFTAGYSEDFAQIPSDLAQAVLLLAAHYYEYRDETALAEGCMPFGVTTLIARYRKMRLGARV